MGTTYPPDGLELLDGVWGTDADQNTAFANLIGPSCIEFKNTTPAAPPYIRHEKSVPAQEGKTYRITGIVQADSVNPAAGGDFVQVGASWYNSADAWISNVAVYNAVLPAINTWYELSGVLTAPANARGMRPFMAKNNHAFTAYVDYLSVDEMPVCFHAYRNAAQAIADTSWDKVEFDVEVYDYGSGYDHAVNHHFTAPSDGIYAFSAAIGVTGLASGDVNGIALFRDTGAGAALWLRGEWTRMQAQTYPTLLTVSVPAALLSRGDTVDVRLWHDFGANRDSRNGSTDAYFMAAKVE